MEIKFAGEPGDACYFLKLGPYGNPNPPEREFQGGDRVRVQIRSTPAAPDCVDLTFEDGQYALEVPTEFFTKFEEVGRASDSDCPDDR